MGLGILKSEIDGPFLKHLESKLKRQNKIIFLMGLVGIATFTIIIFLSLKQQKYVPQLRSPFCPDINESCVIQCESFHNKQILTYDYYAPTTTLTSGRLGEFQFYDIVTNKTVRMNTVTWDMGLFKCKRINHVY